MRKSSTLIGLTLVALGAGARAEDQAPATPAPATVAVDPFPAAAIVAPVPSAPPEPRPRRIKVGLSFLPMGIGKFTTPIGGTPTEGDASLAYGFGLSASYRVIAGLELGIAPQIVYNVNYKTYPVDIVAPEAGKETDLMARVAYTFPIVETIGLYVEALPGYSTISQPGSTTAKGFVLALGGGVEMGVTDRIFLDLGGDYQLGFQSITVSGSKLDDRTKYVRVNLGGGFRF
jgi:opacity protein-like surface antigen